MTKRNILITVSWIVCAGTVLGVLSQRQRLAALRAQDHQMSDRLTPPNPAESALVVDHKQVEGSPRLSKDDSRELLRLRSEITELTARKRELSTVSEEAKQLRAQLAGNETNSSSGIRVPPGYIRKSQAQFVGYATPENTLQSFLAALQNHDLPGVLRAFSPNDADGFVSKLSSSPSMQRDFFKGADTFPGMGIQDRQELPDGSVELHVEFIPGMPSEKLQLRNFNGEWKLLNGF